MRIATIKTISADRPLTDLPVTLIQRSSQWSMVADSIFLAVAGLAFALPAGLFAAEAAAAPFETQTAIVAQPVPAALTLIGLSMLLVPVVFLIRRILTGFGGTRHVTLTDTNISVTDQSLGRPLTWTAPLTTFRGVTHHVRTNLSHTRHELILVHPNPKRSLLLSIADKVTDREVSKLSQRLAMPVLPASCLYRLPGMSTAN